MTIFSHVLPSTKTRRRSLQTSLNESNFLSSWANAHRTKEDGAWKLCELAARCKREKFPDWNARLAVLEKRGERVIRDWARAAELRDIIGTVEGLTYSFYVVAGKQIDRVSPAEIRHLMQTVAADQSATLESFSASLSALAGDDDAPDYAAQFERESARLFGMVDKLTGLSVAASEHVAEAARELKKAAQAVGSETAKTAL